MTDARYWFAGAPAPRFTDATWSGVIVGRDVWVVTTAAEIPLSYLTQPAEYAVGPAMEVWSAVGWLEQLQSMEHRQAERASGGGTVPPPPQLLPAALRAFTSERNVPAAELPPGTPVLFDVGGTLLLGTGWEFGPLSAATTMVDGRWFCALYPTGRPLTFDPLVVPELRGPFR